MPKNKAKNQKVAEEPNKVNINNIKNANETTDQVSQNDDEALQQFELELHWCIEQLMKSLSTNKMNSKQSQDAVKSLNVLRSRTAPIVKKRQVMRMSFGDYRSKMAEQEKKLCKKNLVGKIQMSSPSKSSKFIMRSARSSCVIKKDLFQSSGSEFRFNFDEPHENETENNKASTSEDNHIKNLENPVYKFKSSDNSFRFSFEENSE